MRERNKRNIVIGILCVMVVFMSVGYAILSQNLNINGTANITGSWDIYIDSITFNSNESSSTTSGTGEVDATDKTKASYSANLLKPQDVVIYDVVVANNGTIDAILDDITLTPEDNEYFKFETIGIEAGEELNAKTGDNPTTKSFKIKITFKDSVTEANMPASGTKVDGLVKLDYVQEGVKLETEDVPGVDDQIPAESSPFKVTNDGTLVYYQRQGNETSVKVPAEVNGIKIKRIAGQAFIDNSNALVFAKQGIVVGLDSSVDARGQELVELFELEKYMTWEEYNNQTQPAIDLTREYGKAIAHLIVESGTDREPEFSATTASNHYITTVDLSDAIYLETIGASAFGGIEGLVVGLQNIIFPTNGSLTTIGEYAFRDTNLSGQLVIPDTVTTIEFGAFERTNISSLVLSNNLTKIDQYAFYECDNLTGTLVIPSSVNEIHYLAFVGTGLSKIIIKRENSEGMYLGSAWDPGTAQVVFDPNYVG